MADASGGLRAERISGAASPQKLLRCAIYTRKSTEEGLDQEFNSLDAQREACAAYIASQRHEGWILVPEPYDDGGFTGGNLDRPGLRQLLADIEAGRVDVIVVYKVDRLTRSLADLAKIVEILDARGASFVSVTQAFNTTTSMGRLTLNVLLSFAQFEREVTGERIRDKIAASKKKGMWMGGSVPMGYEVKERKLVVHEAEAETVRFIYKRYIELGTVPALIDDLGRRNIRTKVQVRTSGPHRGGIPFARGSLYHLLRNRIYLGEIVHKGVAYPGEHQPIVPVDLWQAVQARLAGNATRRRHGSGAEHPSLFVGLLHDGLGRRMSPAHANKQSKRYRYYVTHEQARGGEPAWRVPAHDLERLVIDRLQRFLGDEAALHQLVQPNSAAKAQQLLATARRSFDALGAEPDNRIAAIRQLVDRIDLHDDRIDIHVKCAALDVERSTNHLLSLAVKRMRRGHDIRLVIAAPNAIPAQRDEKLVALIAEAHAARRSVFAQTGSLAEIASRLGQCRGRLADRVRLSYLAPDIVTAIVEGRQPSSLDRRKLLATKLSPDWSVQRIQLGFE